MPSPPPREAVVVAYGYGDDLERCLTALTPLCPTHVVDNSSQAAIRDLCDRLGATYDDPAVNLGFARGVNRGVALTSADSDVLLVNPDALVTASTVNQLAEALCDPRVGIVAPSLRDPVTGAAQRVLWPFPSPGRMWRQAVVGGDGGRASSQFAVGAVLLLRRQTLNEVGGFDERFFLYAEETDWQRRAVEAGWQVQWCTDAVAQHVGAGTSTDTTHREALFHAGTETYVRKWHGAAGWQSYRSAVIVGALLRCIATHSLRGEHGRRCRLYICGPRRVAGLDW